MASRLLTPVISLLLCAILYLGNAFSTLSEAILDTLFQVRGETETSQSIVCIGVDEESLKQLGAWPFPRELHGVVLDNLKQAKAIGFDLLFSDITKNDALFNESIRSKPPIVFTAASDYHGKIQVPAVTLYNYFGYGHIDSILSKGGIVRKTKLEKKNNLKAFSLVLLDAAGHPVQLADPSRPRFINFYGPEFTFLYLSYYDVLKNRIPPDFFKDRFVLIGAQAVALGDVHVTPFTGKHPMPGVEIQATILNNLLEDSFLQELPLFSWSLTCFFFYISFALWPTLNERQNIPLNIAGALIPSGLSIYLFYQNYFFDISIPLTVLLLSYLVHLCLQGLWLTKKLVSEISELNLELEDGLKAIYTNIPHQLLSSAKTGQQQSISGGIRRYINKMHDGINALALQNQFINHLLKEEVDPLILWDKNNTNVVLANSMFNKFWFQYTNGKETLPDLPRFLEIVTSHAVTTEIQTPLTIETLDLSGNGFSTDINLPQNDKIHYFQVKIHDVQTSHSYFSGILANITDVTSIHELEKMKSDLLGVVSHELKLPLTTILGYSEMLHDFLDGESKQFAKEIQIQSKRLNRLIENFLDLARIESGKYKIRRIPLDLAVVILDSINAVSPMADKKRITIFSEIPSKVTPFIGDEPLLLQMIVNLLDNGIKFSPSGSTVRITLVEEKDRFVLVLSDQGPGISLDDRARIFEKFNRGSEQKNKEGIGLGLSLVKEVIENHNGTISLTSSPVNGTSFRILLPKPELSSESDN